MFSALCSTHQFQETIDLLLENFLFFIYFLLIQLVVVVERLFYQSSAGGDGVSSPKSRPGYDFFMEDRQFPMQHAYPLYATDVVQGKDKGRYFLAPLLLQELLECC